MQRIRRLSNPIQHYDWGSHTALAALLGRPGPTPRPEAELWIGAHPQGFSRILDGDQWRALPEWIAADPNGVLGAAVVSRFGVELPFLLKVLAVEQPLSLQAHPDARQAREGFEREQRSGIPLDAERRNYRDPRHKPELLCALTPFRALVGFRGPEQIVASFEQLGVQSLAREVAALRRQPDRSGWEQFFRTLLTLSPERQGRIVSEATASANRVEPRDAALQCLLQLAEAHPNDVGALSPLFLNFVELEAGQALFLPARELHCYLRGVALEVMASSDNVLRGGLTRKHVDVGELLRVVHFAEAKAAPLAPERASAVERVYRVPADEFQLSVISCKGASSYVREGPPGVELLLCTEGQVDVADSEGDEIALARGESLFVPARAKGYGISGEGTIFRVCVPPGTGPVGGS